MDAKPTVDIKCPLNDNGAAMAFCLNVVETLSQVEDWVGIGVDFGGQPGNTLPKIEEGKCRQTFWRELFLEYQIFFKM